MPTELVPSVDTADRLTMSGDAESRSPGPLPSGRHPQSVVFVLTARKALRSGTLWGLVFGCYVAIQIDAYVSAYPTKLARDQLAHAYGTNAGLDALLGVPRAINTVAGYAEWRLLGILGIVGCLWGLLTSTRLMRGEEDAGRSELLLAGQTTRRRAGAQTMMGLGVGLAAAFAVTAIGMIVVGHSSSVGIGFGRSLSFSVTLVAGAALFLAIGALTSQLANTRRRAASMAGIVFGVAFALRMVADSNPSLHWMVWLSPLGWIEQARSLTDPHPAVLLLVLVLLIAISTLTLHLAHNRDLGAATVPDRNSSTPHLALLGSPPGLAVRLMRPVALGWLFGVTAFAVLIGTTAESATTDPTGSKGIAQAIGRLGGHGALVEDYLGLTFLILALLVALVAAGQVTAMRGEESDGHLENLLVRPMSRATWFFERWGLASLLLVAAGIAAGAGAWTGAASQHSAVDFGSLVVAGINIVPPSVFLLGLGLLVFGAWPRATSTAVYGYLAWSFLVELVGGVVHANHWLLDTSMFFHMVPAPAANPDWLSAAVIAGLGVVGVILGGICLQRRDLKNA
jgi:ABC-2 type transport system permease protein